MYTTIQKWGNSQAVRLPRTILETADLRENDRVEIVAEKGVISIRRAEKQFSSLDELFRDYPGGYRCKEIDTGKPIGKEVF